MSLFRSHAIEKEKPVVASEIATQFNEEDPWLVL